MSAFTPCPDTSCLGVIGPDGRCTICGSTSAADLQGIESREPCPDGACIGVIGERGRCTECGTLARSDPGGPLRAPASQDEREPCPDGACIGVIGEDGRCTECDRTAVESSSPPAVHASDEAVPEPPELEGPEDRTPCRDGACIGIIGADGRCTECGRRY